MAGPLAPTVAVIGGGQLARMMAEPAAALGIPLRLLAEAEGVSAAQVVPDHLVGDHTDLETLRRVTEGCAAVTFDHEHVPTDHLHALREQLPVHPGPDALVHAQDKAVMRARLADLGVPCPRNAVVASVTEVEEFGLPCVLKTTRGGYDGKGVWFVSSADQAAEVFATAAGQGRTILAEERIDFRRELSALVARSPSGQLAVWPVVASTQRDGICHEVIAPAPDLDPDLAVEAQRAAIADPVRFLITDREFHFAIYRACGNPALADFVIDLYGYMMEHRRRAVSEPGAIAASWDDHRRIVDALTAHDREAVVAGFAVHLERIHRTTRSSLDAAGTDG